MKLSLISDISILTHCLIAICIRANNIAVWTKDHSICSLDTKAVAFDPIAETKNNGLYILNSSLVICREAPYMEFVRTNLAKKQAQGEEFKTLILQSIMDLYADLEVVRKPVVINLSKGKTVGTTTSVDQGIQIIADNGTIQDRAKDKLVLLHPISFCIPEENIIKTIPSKKQAFGNVIPGKISTYFPIQEESRYYADMQHSFFVLTFKKGGWDCLRHYEILASGSLPLFLHIKHCPSQALVAHPKKLYQLLLKHPGLDVQGSRSGLHTIEIEKLHLNMVSE